MGLFDQLEAHLSFLPQGSGDGYGYGGGAIVSLGNRAVFLGEGNNALAQEIVDRWNAMLGIPDPAATMKEVREVLGKLAAVKIERAVPEVEATDPWPGSRVLFGYDGWELTVGDVRHARALLAKMGGK